MNRPGSPSVDPAEIAKFEKIASDWWNPDSKFKPLHKFNPARLAFIRDSVCGHFERDPTGPRPYDRLRFLDVGCGGGLLSEPLARLGADVIAIDPSPVNVEAARIHARQSGLQIDYRALSAEDLSADGIAFDVILAMEVVEHVADLHGFLQACTAMLKPGGLIFVATINRTRKAYLFAIIGAERILRWLPPGTHDYDRLVRPDELEDALVAGGARVLSSSGMVFNPLTDRWSVSSDRSVNYVTVATSAR